MDSGEFKGPFHADGQVSLIEDYLEVRPEKTEKIRARLSQNMISAGPWYNLPDEFLISGEAMIRNFRLGHQIVKDLGGTPSKAGYLSDMFGHISQMPQIFKGFGIKAAFIWRGTDREQRNVIWKGADGTQIPTYVFSPYGYGEYSLFVREVDRNFFSEFKNEGFPERVEKFVNQECDQNAIEPVLIFDGVDLLCWDRAAYNAFFNHYKNDSRFEIKHVHLDEYMDTMLENYGDVKKVLDGELTSVATNFINDNTHCLYGTISSRADIKHNNTYCQNMLSCWAEPFAIYTNLLTGKEFPKAFLDIAWKWLMKNHPHDSICGCSIDEVHKDMEFRFSQAKQISQKLTSESLKTIGASVDVTIDEDQIKLVVFNPLQQDINEVVIVPVKIPKDWPFYFEFLSFENLPAFRIFDACGKEINYQKIAITPNMKNVYTFRTKVPYICDMTQIDIALPLNIPALGYQTLIIKKARQAEPVRHPLDSKLAHSGNILENQFIKAVVESNGTVTLTDKQTGEIYNNLMAYEENADIGNGWFHGIALNDEIISSKQAGHKFQL
jgi:alpha-mannosidase/mannosylglycerate hydrolase